MKNTTDYTINCGGRLISLAEPLIAGIVNVTPDSFYEGSRTFEEEKLRERVSKMLHEGADMIDIGAYSTRPGAFDVPPQEEMQRLRRGMHVIRELAPQIPVSVDTFRADVARMAVEECGADIINDISGGELDKDMFRTVAALRVPYILMHTKGTPQTMQQMTHYDDLVGEVFSYLAERVERLHLLGVNDVILDPGFGFAKTVEQNYRLMHHLGDFQEFHLPLLVGVSRKSMIFRLLGTTPKESLNGSSVLHTYALLNGANILRVHDVREAVEAREIVKNIRVNA